MYGGAVDAIEHAAVRHDGDGLRGMALGQCCHGLYAARVESIQRFAAAWAECGFAQAPALGFFWPLLFDGGVGLAFKAAKATFAQRGIGLHLQAGGCRQRCCGLAGA